MKKKKLQTILILTASTGQGHNAAADSLKEELERNGYEVIKAEPFKKMGASFDEFMADGYKLLATKMPVLYGTLYKLSNQDTKSMKLSNIFVKKTAKTIKKMCALYNPTLIISTHPLLVGGVTLLKSEGIIHLPFISVITDLLPHMSYVNKQYVDAYITGAQQTADELINRGIDPGKIHVFGIPIRREFIETEDTSKIERDESFTILLMGGSMGLGGMKKAFKHILNVKRNLKLIAVCGNNEHLKETLLEKIEEASEEKLRGKTIQVLGFTNKVAQFMDISDVIITKPGGITVSEALMKRIPMVIPFYIPGQEAENTEVLIKAGAAIEVTTKNMEEKLEELIDDPEQLKKMKENIEEVTKTHSLDNTVALAIQLINEYQKDKTSLTKQEP